MTFPTLNAQSFSFTSPFKLLDNSKYRDVHEPKNTLPLRLRFASVFLFNGFIPPVVSVSNTAYCRTNSLIVSTVPVPVLKIPTVVSREHRLTFCTMLLLQVCSDDQPLYGLLQLRTVNLQIFLCLLRFPGADA